MDLELDSATGVFIALLVSAVSVVLYYMFKHASFVSRNPSPNFSSTDLLAKKRKGKKNDTKKQKQARKHKRDASGCEKDDGNDETDEEEVNVEVTDHFTPLTRLLNSVVDDEVLEVITTKIQQAEQSKLSYRLQPCHPDVDSASVPTGGTFTSQSSTEVTVQDPKLSSPETIKNLPLVDNLSNSEDSDSRFIKDEQHEEKVHEPSATEQQVSSKKKKRRSVKFHPVVTSSVESKLSKASPTEAETKVNDQLLTSESQSEEQNNIKFLRIEVNRLLAQLKTAQHQLDEQSKHVTVQTEENSSLRKKEEETSLGLRVLREQYTELLRTNKGIDHKKAMTVIKLNHLQQENEQLAIRLQNSEDNTNQCKQKIKQLLDQLNDTENKLTHALANAASPDPLPEIVRAQEIAQQNLRLTTCLEQKDSELGQLRQAHAIHQKEIQTLRESITEKNTRLQELRLQLQVEQTEYNSRIAASEAELQRCRQEYECEKQNMARQLTKALNEAAVYREQEKRHMDTINSLQYQFSELNAHQHRLIGQVSSEKAANDSRIGGLQAELANTQSQVLRVTSELTAAEQRCASLRTKLEQREEERQAMATRWSPVQTSSRAISTEDNEQQLGKLQASPSSPKERVGDYSAAAMAQLETVKLELEASKAALEKATEELAEAKDKQRATDEQLKHYKDTLVQTEDTLARLQAVAESSETNWQRLLSDSQESEARLRSQLTAAVNAANQTVAEVKCLEQRLVDGQMMVQRLQLQLEQIKSEVRSNQSDIPELEGERKDQTGLSDSQGGDPGLDRPSPAVIRQYADLAVSDIDSDEVLVDHADLCGPYSGDR